MADKVEHRSKPNFFDIDFEKAPFIAIWEVTRACDLRCVHCRAEAIPNRDPDELTKEQGFKLIDELRAFSETAPPLFVLTGGDPIKSPFVYDYIKYADEVGLRVAVTPSAAPRKRQLSEPGTRSFMPARSAGVLTSLGSRSTRWRWP